MVADPSAISWGAIANRSAIGRRLVGDCILNVCLWLQKVCNFLEIGRQSIGDWSAISRRLNTVSGLSATAATGRRSVANQSATCRQPVGDHQKPFYDRFGRREVSLAATKTSLRSNRPCNRLQPVGDWSPTSLQPPCNLPATTRNFGRKEVAYRLQAMCDRGFSCFKWCKAIANPNVHPPCHPLIYASNLDSLIGQIYDKRSVQLPRLLRIILYGSSFTKKNGTFQFAAAICLCDWCILILKG